MFNNFVSQEILLLKDVMNVFFHLNLFCYDRKFEWKIKSRLTQSVQKQQRRVLKEITKAERQLRVLDALTLT
jgi:hypothetical protein